MSPSPIVVVAVGVAAVAVHRWQHRRATTQAPAAAAPAALDLCAVVLGAGGTIGDALVALAASGPEPVRAAANRALARAAAGDGLDLALRWLQADLGPTLQPLTGALLLAQQQGGPVGLTLARLAAEASAGRRRLGEVRARRLPVALLVPLVACSLPAVIVGAVMPLAVVAFRQIRL
ncbi:MAG: type II secretion system F family protein [Acidimicrobiia bacterium]|nr:type II secretion system F family protein [Acidimicrobiia bacterium]